MPPDDDADRGFFATLPAFDGFGRIVDAGVYAPVPPSWHVLVTDVVDSTGAIRAGRYKDVNALGGAVIVAAVNAAADVELAYVFGGDGAVVLGPAAARPALLRAAAATMRLAREAFGLTLRAGLVPVADLVAAGAAIHAAKLRLAEGLHLAMLDGPGVTRAEAWVRDPARAAGYAVAAAERHDATLFEGFECRWKPVASRRGRIVSLIVLARAADAGARREVYAAVLRRIAGLEPDDTSVRPVSSDTLRLAESSSELVTEARVRTGRRSGARARWHALRASATVAIGRSLVRRRRRWGDFDGASYIDDVVERTDFRKFDGSLRMVLDLSAERTAELRRILEEERAAGRIVFGLHADAEALLTCLVRDHTQHVHFLDGGGGGYALAAVELKTQLRAAR